MRESNLDTGNHISLTIAADARLSTTNYLDDQIWELSLKNGEPPSLALETTYGLRAANVRLFPRFTESHNSVSDPKKFKLPFRAYKGENPFIFVSYAHSDKLQVYPIMDFLNKSGFNIWYDEGISVSEEWIKSIVTNIEKSSAFLVFISPHIIDSKYVRREISYALDIDKPFYAGACPHNQPQQNQTCHVY